MTAPLIALRLYRYYRQCGLPRWPAAKKAIRNAGT